MQKFKNAARVSVMYVVALLLVGSYPLAAYAQTPVSIPPVVTEDVAPVAPVAPERTYTYNEEAQRWESDKYKYDTTSGKYYAVPPPAPIVVTPTPAPSATGQSAPVVTTPENTTSIDTTTQAVIDNSLNSNATTGNAAVKHNTTAGNASTGDASAIANFMNSINSSVDGGNGAEFATFVTDVVGDVHGDIMLYPMLLKAMLQAAAQPKTGDTAIKTSTSSEINNDINLTAQSGDATVSGNTNAGSATTGTANTVANVMNFINSMIAANGSFVGTINIHGNLDGDILVAPDFLPQLLTSNTNSSSAPASTLKVSSDDMQSIVNNVNLNAETGDAVVAKNTNAGNATTGDASTNLVLLNMTGHQVVASNSLLVFVNVLGQWVGIIVDAPTGATAAALGNGVTSHTQTPQNLNVDSTNESKITNNITLNSQSGDATVEKNTNAGNAITGNATASANIANITGSQLGLSDWFGILFINVFGSWHGSFGVDTANGTIPIPDEQKVTAQPVNAMEAPQAIQFVPKSPSVASPTTKTTYVPAMIAPSLQQLAAVEPVVEEEVDEPVVLASQSSNTPSVTTTAPQEATNELLPYITASFTIGLGMIAIRNIVSAIRTRIAA